MNELPDLLKEAMNEAKNTFSKMGAVGPMLIVNNGAKVFSLPLESMPSEMFTMILGEVVKKFTAQEVVLVVEAWAASCDPHDYRDWEKVNAMADGKSISELDDKKEVVMINYASRSLNEDIIMMANIKRKPDDLDEWAKLDSGATGRLANLTRFFKENNDEI